MSALILNTTEGGASRIQLRTDGQKVWLTQLEMAELFVATKQNISWHLKNLFEDREMAEDAVVKEFLTTAAAGMHYQPPSASVELSREETIKESLTVQTEAKEPATTRGFSVDQTVDDGQASGRPKFWNQVVRRQRHLSTLGN
jgi:hypothetical protein